MQLSKTFNLPKLFLILIYTTLVACSSTKLSEQVQEKTGALQTKTTEEAEKIAATQPTKPPASFKISGAIAVNNKGKGWNANINWQQQDVNHYTIRLSGPLGSKTVIINKNGSSITYQEGAKIIHAKSEQDLLKNQANINLPVHDLYYWVRGIQAPGAINIS